MTRLLITDSNEEQLLIVQAGTEVEKGVAVAPTFKFYPTVGQFSLVTSEGLVDKRENTGTYFPHKTPITAPMTVAGSMSQGGTFEDFPIWARYNVAGGGAGVADGGAPPAHTYAKRHSANRKSFDTMTWEHGFPGLPYQAEMVYIPEWTVSQNSDDAEADWKFTGTLWARISDLKDLTTGTATGGTTSTIVMTGAGWTVNQFAGAFAVLTDGTANNIGEFRRILSNTADTLTLDAPVLPAAVVATDTLAISGAFTQGVPDRDTESIPGPGTRVFLADSSEAVEDPGTELVDALISWSVTSQLNTTGKRFTNNLRGYGKKFGKGGTVITAQLVVEFDSRREHDKWRDKTVEKIRIRQDGSLIHDTPDVFKRAQIDIFRGVYDTAAQQTRENNRTLALTLRAYLDSVEGVPAAWTAVLPENTLP